MDEVSAHIVINSATREHPSTSCAEAQFKIGTASVSNDTFAIICFAADGTLSSVLRPGYEMEFHDARAFGKKRIAYRYITDLGLGVSTGG